MNVTIELPSDMETDLIAQACGRGLDLPRYIEHVLREQIPVRAGSDLTPAERAAAWRESSRDLPHTPPLSENAISREKMYGDRGR